MNGFYNKRDHVLLIMIVLFTITLSAFLVINANFIYLITIKYLDLNDKYQISTNILMHNIRTMINFIQNPCATMNLWHYRLSKVAYEHFIDVRKLVVLNNIILASSCIYLGLVGMYKSFIIHLWKLTDYLKKIMLIIGIFMFICLVDFNDVFFYLHRLVFPNHNWIFNPKKDPIIEVLPDQYFFSCFLLWFILVFFILISFYLYGKWQIKKKKH